MGVKAQAEVVVDDIQRQLEEDQGTGMRSSCTQPTPPHSHLCRKGAKARPSQLLGSPTDRLHTRAAWLLFPGLTPPRPSSNRPQAHQDPVLLDAENQCLAVAGAQ